jgi:ATPase subunit of ABC transporter with duplicated ATPase domains
MLWLYPTDPLSDYPDDLSTRPGTGREYAPIIPPVMLALTNISLRRGRKVLLESASFQIHAGQRMGVIGANGCGKSSLFAMLLGELEPDDGELALDSRYERPLLPRVRPQRTSRTCTSFMNAWRPLTALRPNRAHRDYCMASGSQRMNTLKLLKRFPVAGACG